MKNPPGTPRTASPKCTARRIYVPLTTNFYGTKSLGGGAKIGGDGQDMALPGVQLRKVLFCQAFTIHCKKKNIYFYSKKFKNAYFLLIFCKISPFKY